MVARVAAGVTVGFRAGLQMPLAGIFKDPRAGTKGESGQMLYGLFG